MAGGMAKVVMIWLWSPKLDTKHHKCWYAELMAHFRVAVFDQYSNIFQPALLTSIILSHVLYFIYYDHCTIYLPRLTVRTKTCFYKNHLWLHDTSYNLFLHGPNPNPGTSYVNVRGLSPEGFTHPGKNCPCYTVTKISGKKHHTKNPRHQQFHPSPPFQEPTPSRISSQQTRNVWVPSRASHMKTHRFIATWRFSECKSASSRKITNDASPNHHYNPRTLMVWQHHNSRSGQNPPRTHDMTW